MWRNATPLAAAAALAVAGIASASGSEVLLARGNTLAGWTTQCDAGTCSLGLSDTATPFSGLSFFNFSYSLGANDWNAQIKLEDSLAATALDVPMSVALSMKAYQSNASVAYYNLIVLITDATGKQLSNYPTLRPGWNNVSMVLDETGGWYPQKTAIALPIKSLSFGANKNGQGLGNTGWLGFADVALASNATSIPNQLLATLLQPRQDVSGVLVSGNATDGVVSVGVQLTNRLTSDCTANLTVRMRNATGVMGGGDDPSQPWGSNWVDCVGGSAGGGGGSLVPGWGTLTAACNISALGPPGYVSVQAILSGSTCWTGNDTQQVYEAAVAIVPPQPAITPVQRNRRSNVFGGQMVPNPASAARIGMWTVRSGPLWRWAQGNECWEDSCFDWGLYDEPFALSAEGIEIMIDAREIAPPWAAAKNDSGGAWSEFPGPAHYADYQRYLTLMLNRYGPYATMVEVSNEDDGLSYFMPDPIPMDSTCIPLSYALINITAAAMEASVNASGLDLVGLSSSMFDVKQLGNGGSTYAYYERAMLLDASTGYSTVKQLKAVTAHPYTNGVYVPWNQQPWGNISFQFPNEAAGPGFNGTVAQLLLLAGLMEQAAAAAGMGASYVPDLRLSELGYAYAIPSSAASGWAVMHAAVVAQALIHMRSEPLSPYVTKALLFAAYDGCCPESNTFYGIWRPNQLRTGPNATEEYVQPTEMNTGSLMPLPGVSAYATASVMVDVPSGRQAGVVVVDHTTDGSTAPPGQQLPPTCIAFEPATTPAVGGTGTVGGEGAGEGAGSGPVQPLAVLFLTGHHYNDRSTVKGTVAGSAPYTGLQRVSGLGSPLPLTVDGATGAVTIDVAPLPQYILLPAPAQPGSNTVAADFCKSLTW